MYIHETHHLSVDQNPKKPAEAARLSALHPGEPEFFNKNRVLGWAPTRAFGDGMMEWSLELQQRLHEDFLGDRPRDVCKTPPYFTAEPVITTTEGVRKGDFAVFASDGLWDSLSEEIVRLIYLWLEKNGVEKPIGIPGGGKVTILLPMDKSKVNPNDWPAISGDPAKALSSLPSAEAEATLPSKLPVIYPSDYKDAALLMYKYWHREKKFVCEDLNVAIHLVRNALGGGNLDFSRDDITVSVAFCDSKCHST